MWRGVDVPAVGGGLCVCVPGRDVAEGRGLLLGEGGEGALERLDADGVHGIVCVVISKDDLDGRADGDSKTEGAMEQRKADLPGQRSYMGAIPARLVANGFLQGRGC